jgi:pyridoxine 5-phosphate synthase
MVKLSVNINKIATIRNARGGNIPDLVKAARDIESFGADGITVHPRPDERHVRYSDLRPIKEVIIKEFNIEGYPSEDFILKVLEIKPEQVTLVPDPPNVLTSNAGWDCIENADFLRDVIRRFKSAGIRTSIFLNPDPIQVVAATQTGTDRIELYTEAFASGFEMDKAGSVLPYITAAEKAVQLGLGLNAGHDLNLNNLRFFVQHVPGLMEVSIGHALISDALYFGLENTVQLYKRELRS